jgi:hypothetical protein
MSFSLLACHFLMSTGVLVSSNQAAVRPFLIGIAVDSYQQRAYTPDQVGSLLAQRNPASSAPFPTSQQQVDEDQLFKSASNSKAYRNSFHRSRSLPFLSHRFFATRDTPPVTEWQKIMEFGVIRKEQETALCSIPSTRG